MDPCVTKPKLLDKVPVTRRVVAGEKPHHTFRPWINENHVCENSRTLAHVNTSQRIMRHDQVILHLRSGATADTFVGTNVISPTIAGEITLPVVTILRMGAYRYDHRLHVLVFRVAV